MEAHDDILNSKAILIVVQVKMLISGGECMGIRKILLAVAGISASFSGAGGALAQSRQADICNRIFSSQIRICANNPETSRSACEARTQSHLNQCLENARNRDERTAARRRN